MRPLLGSRGMESETRGATARGLSVASAAGGMRVTRGQRTMLEGKKYRDLET